MNIRYSTRSRFFDTIHEALESNGTCPDQDDPVTIELSQECYDGSVLVEITPDLPDEFRSNWNGRDETRFPVRIRAAATVLRDRGCYGRFLMPHQQGVLTISRAAW